MEVPSFCIWLLVPGEHLAQRELGRARPGLLPTPRRPTLPAPRPARPQSQLGRWRPSSDPGRAHLCPEPLPPSLPRARPGRGDTYRTRMATPTSSQLA